jgi:hypothetical protein
MQSPLLHSEEPAQVSPIPFFFAAGKHADAPPLTWKHWYALGQAGFPVPHSWVHIYLPSDGPQMLVMHSLDVPQASPNFFVPPGKQPFFPLPSWMQLYPVLQALLAQSGVHKPVPPLPTQMLLSHWLDPVHVAPSVFLPGVVPPPVALMHAPYDLPTNLLQVSVAGQFASLLQGCSQVVLPPLLTHNWLLHCALALHVSPSPLVPPVLPPVDLMHAPFVVDPW